VKHLLLLFVSCAAVFQCSNPPAALSQENMSSIASDRSSTPGAGKGKGFRVKHTFTGADGGMPTAALIQDLAGNLYGTTSSGGDSGLGVVFKLDTTNNTESVLHAFAGPDGATPHGGVVRDGFGNLYGTTSSGGASGLGVVFKIDTTGTESVLHNFTGSPDGAQPYAGLVVDNSGNLYGTTETGGAFGFGTVFRVDRTGESVLHSFAGGASDGADPTARVILDETGNLYGTTFSGGTSGKGTVFELDTTNVETVLYNFTGGADGGNPFAGLTLDRDGTLYGTTENGGKKLFPSQYGCCKGVLFAISGAFGSSSEKVLYTFTGGRDGGTPAADLVLHNGALYGTTLSGGPGHRGTAFSVTVASGQEQVLHGFTGKSDGATPHAGLLINAAGVIYGTAEKGGHFKQGTVFQYNK